MERKNLIKITSKNRTTVTSEGNGKILGTKIFYYRTVWYRRSGSKFMVMQVGIHRSFFHTKESVHNNINLHFQPLCYNNANADIIVFKIFQLTWETSHVNYYFHLIYQPQAMPKKLISLKQLLLQLPWCQILRHLTHFNRLNHEFYCIINAVVG